MHRLSSLQYIEKIVKFAMYMIPTGREGIQLTKIISVCKLD